MSAQRKTAAFGLVAALAVAVAAAIHMGSDPAAPGTADAGAPAAGEAGPRVAVEVPVPEGIGNASTRITRRPANTPARRAAAKIDATRGAISGFVLDPEGKARPAATVRARLEAASAREAGATTVTATDGSYLLGGLAEGIYAVDARADGLRADPQGGVTVRPGEETSGVDFLLDRGERILGIVRGDGETPIEGATVSVRNVLRGAIGPRAQAGEAESSGKTRADGTFEVAGLTAGKKAVTAHAPGYRRSDPVMVDLKSGEAGRVELALERGTFLAGIVTMRAGEPVSGAKLEVRPARGGGGPFQGGGRADDVVNVTSGEDGKWRAEGLTGRRFNVLCLPADGTLSPGLLTNIEAKREDVNFLLDPGAAIGGVVVAAGTKAPIEGAAVSIGEPPYRKGTTTGADGRFLLAPLPELDNQTLRASAAGRSPVEQRVRLKRSEQRTDLVIELPEGCAIDGRVFALAGGRPLEGAVVRVISQPREDRGGAGRAGGGGARGGRRGGGGGPFGGGGPGQGEELMVEVLAGANQSELSEWLSPEELDALLARNTTTDSRGRFRFTDLPVGDHKVYAAHFEHPGNFAMASLSEPGDHANVEIGLPEGGGIAGKVTDDNAAPRVDVLVLGFSLMGKARSARTNENGEYAMKGLAAGSYFVSLGVELRPPGTGGARGPARDLRANLAQGFTAKTANVEAGRVARVDFGAEPKTAVAGRVLRAGEPVKDQFVQFFPEGGVQGLTGAMADAEGRYEVAVPAGKYLIRVDNVSENLVVAAGVQRIEHDVLLPSGAVSGRVLNAASNEPLRGGRVRLYKAERAGQVDTLTGALGAIAGDTRVRDDGGFRVAGLAPGLYTITADGDGFATTRKDGIEVPPDGELPGVELACEPGGIIRGLVLDDKQEPVPGASIWIVDAAAKDLTMGDPPRADEEGRFEIKRFSPGRYRVTVLTETLAPWRQYVDFQGGTTELAVALVPGGTIDVSVSGPGGFPVPGAAVELRYADGDRIVTGFLDFVQPTQPTGPDGKFRKSRLPPGPVRGLARLERPGQATLEGTFEATIANGAEALAATTLREVTPPAPPAPPGGAGGPPPQ